MDIQDTLRKKKAMSTTRVWLLGASLLSIALFLWAWTSLGARLW